MNDHLSKTPTIKNTSKYKVAYMYSKKYLEILDSVMTSIHKDRDVLLHSLIKIYDKKLVSPNYLRLIEPNIATKTHLSSFHSVEYLNAIMDSKNLSDPELQEYNFLEENSTIAQHAELFFYCQYIAGASIHAASLLSQSNYTVAINWGGGRHHALSNQACGFCFVNDIVLSIQHLLQYYPKVMYIDIDIHHGNGVQEAFYNDYQVLTISFHRFVQHVFFPAEMNGSKDFRGKEDGLGYNLNIPLPSNMTDEDYIDLFNHALLELTTAFSPQALVLCLGADGLEKDPLVSQVDSGFCLTPFGIKEIISKTTTLCLEHDIKLLLLGGGGYHPVKTAFTYFLSTLAVCHSILPFEPDPFDTELPRSYEYWKRFYDCDCIYLNHDSITTLHKKNPCLSWKEKEEYELLLTQGRELINKTKEYLVYKENQINKNIQFQSYKDDEEENDDDDDDWVKDCFKISKKTSHKRRKRK